MFRLIAVFIIGVLSALGAPMAGSASCPVGTSVSVYAQTGFSCTLGGLTFYNFSYDSSVIAGSDSVLSGESVTVVPFTDGVESGFVFVGPFTVHTGSIVDYAFGFTADPPPPVIRGYSVTLTRGTRRSPGPQGNATLLSVQCQTFVEGSCNEYSAASAFTAGVEQKLQDDVAFTPVPIVEANLRLTLDGTKGGVVIQSLSASVFTLPGAEIPEPGTKALLFGGLILLAGAKPIHARCLGRKP